MQFWKNRKMCLSRNLLYQYFVFFPVWESFSSENIFYSLHSTKIFKKIWATPGSLKKEKEIAHILFVNF